MTSDNLESVDTFKQELSKRRIEIDDEALETVRDICRTFRLNAQAFAVKWKTHAMNAAGGQLKGSLAEVEKFRGVLAAKQQFVKKEPVTPQSHYTKQTVSKLQEVSSAFAAFGADVDYSTPVKHESKRARTDTSGSPFFDSPGDSYLSSSSQESPGAVAAQSGKVEVTFGDAVPLGGDDPTFDVSVELDPSSQTERYRFMNAKPAKIADALEERVERLTASIVRAHLLSDPEIFHIPSQEPLTAVGRIQSEIEGKLGSGAKVLESTRSLAKTRVRVMIEDLVEYSVFPGQVVAADATNPSGALLIVERLYDGVALPFHQPPPTIPPQTSPVSVMVGCGPWTSGDRMDYRPLHDFLNEAKKLSPKVIILIGPFVDTQHPMIRDDQLETPHGKMFANLLDDIDRRAPRMSKTVIVPSLRDVHHHYVLPQPPFAPPTGDKQFVMAPNPGVLRVNGLTIGVCEADIIKALSGEEIGRSVAGVAADRMARLCQHLVTQQSFYPLYPAALTTPIDWTHTNQLDLPYTPDIMIVPSDLNFFVKNVRDVLFINPGKAMKGKSRGTFARLTVAPPAVSVKNEAVADDGVQEAPAKQRVVERSRVEIVRL